MADVVIQSLLNGPLKVSGLGDIELRDHEGGVYDLRGREDVYLCRCGQSSNKPFCDGTHRNIEFQASDTATVYKERQRQQSGG
jgi:CDGSH-type Zn-finger protein